VVGSVQVVEEAPGRDLELIDAVARRNVVASVARYVLMQ
jgi:hypothetical protein